MFPRKLKTLTLALMVAFTASLMVESVSHAQKSRRPSSSSRSSGFGSSSSSKPKFGQSSSSKKPSGSIFGSNPSAKKPSTSSKPQFGQSKPPTSSKPPATSSKPQFGQSSKPTNTKPAASSKPKFGQGSPTTSARPPTQKNPSTTSSSKRPGSTVGTKSDKASALSRAASQRRYEETKKATAPPKSTYTTSSGKTVNVRKDSAAVSTIRSRPSSYYTPSQRIHRTEIHFNNYGYSHPYDYYYSRPSFYVGGGYSSAFWWMMAEWSAERRARWLYHNRANIEQSAYERGMQDQAVAAELARLQTEQVAVDSNYIDPEFAENPDLMYSQEYVEAAYNPTVVPASTGGGGTVLIVILCLFVGAFLFWLVFVKRWN